MVARNLHGGSRLAWEGLAAWAKHILTEQLKTCDYLLVNTTDVVNRVWGLCLRDTEHMFRVHIERYCMSGSPWENMPLIAEAIQTDKRHKLVVGVLDWLLGSQYVRKPSYQPTPGRCYWGPAWDP